MTRLSRLLTALTVALMPTFALGQTEERITITLVDETALNPQVPVQVTFIEAPGKVGRSLPRGDLGDGRTGWRVELPFPPLRWMQEPTFVIKVPRREATDVLPVVIPASESTISFRIRAIFDPRAIEVPVALIWGIGNAQFDAIEAMLPRDRLKQIVLLGQLSAFWLSDKQTGDRARRGTALLFDSILREFKSNSPDRMPVTFDSDVEARIRNAFAGKDDFLNTRFLNDIRWVETAFWKEKDAIFDLTLQENGRCDMALLILKYISEKHTIDESAALVQGVRDPAAEFAAMRDDLAEHGCVPSTSTGGPPL